MKELNTFKTVKAGGILAVAGAAVFGIGFVLSGFKLSVLQTVDKYKTRTVDVSGSVKAVEISEDNTNINLTKSDDKDIHVICYENKDEKYDISDNDTLKIKKKNTRKIYIGININTQNTTLEVQIPENYKGDLKIDTESSNIRLDEISAKSCDVSLDDGNVRMSECSINGDFKIKNGSGNVNLTDSNFSSEVSVKTSDGNVKFEKCSLDDASNIKVGSGNVKLENITCNSDLTVKTDDGNVKGTINGDKDKFNIESKTVDGNNNLKNKDNGEDKTLSVKTITGNIDIEFE